KVAARICVLLMFLASGGGRAAVSVKKDGPRRMALVTPQVYGFLTLSSGRTFKYLSTAPVLGVHGTRLGLGLSYVSDTRDLKRLEAAADELFGYMRAVAELRHEQTVVIIANLSFTPGEEPREGQAFNIVYTRESLGKWKRLPHDRVPHQTTNDASISGIGLVHDRAAEKEALANAEAWLALFDAGHYAQTWDAAARLLQDSISRERWDAEARSISGTLGQRVSRTKISSLSTRFIPGAPPGSYVVIEYQTKY